MITKVLTKLKRWCKSITVQLWLIFIFFTAALFVIFSLSFGQAMSRNFQNVLAPHMVQYMKFTLRDIGTPPNIDRAEAIGGNLPLTLWIQGPKNFFWASESASQRTSQEFRKHLDYYDDHNYRDKYFKANESVGLLDDLEQWGESDHGKKDQKFGHYRPKKSHPIPRYLQKKLGGRAWMIRSETGIIFGIKKGKYRYYFEFEVNHRAWEQAATMLIVGTLMLLGLLFLLLRWLFKPVQEISKGVKQFSSGNLDYRIPLRKRNELSVLANNTNVMAERLRAYLDSKRVLLLGMSHELRTPITRSKLTLEFLPDGPEKSNLKQDLVEMTGIIEELLAAERVGDNNSSLQLTTVNIRDLVETTLGQMADTDRVLQAVENIYLQADSARLKLLIRNLVSNALRHNRDEKGQITVSAKQTATTFTLSVQDFGCGISAQHLAKVTEPFYRADSARTREDGGVGLGLYLCKVIAEAHGGSLRIDSVEGEGTTVSCVLQSDKAL